MGIYVRKTYLLSHFSPEDFYQIHSTFEKLKKQNNLQNVQLLKLKAKDSACFYLSGLRGSSIVLSENTLDSFDQKEMACFLSYAFQKIKSGDLLFLTVLSAFLFLLEKVFYILSYPLVFFKRKKNLGMAVMLKILSLMTKGIFYSNDKKLLLQKKTARNQALFLWKLDSWTALNPPQLPLFFAPLFLTNFLTNFYEKDYISLQPLIKNRVKKLVGGYPP